MRQNSLKFARELVAFIGKLDGYSNTDHITDVYNFIENYGWIVKEQEKTNETK